MCDASTDQLRGRWIRRPLVITLLAAAIVLGLTPFTPLGQPASATAPRYDGDTLVRGVFFRLGPVAERYPRLVLGQIPEPERNTELMPRLFTEAERLVPGFRNQFAEAMYSHDRLRMQRSVVDTARTLIGAVVVLYPELADEPSGDAQSGTALANTLWAFDFVARSTYTNVVVEAMTVVGFVTFWGYQDPGSAQDLQLRIEQWADLAATTMPGN